MDHVAQIERGLELLALCQALQSEKDGVDGGFNRSMQQLDGIVQPVYRSLVSCVDVR